MGNDGFVESDPVHTSLTPGIRIEAAPPTIDTSRTNSARINGVNPILTASGCTTPEFYALASFRCLYRQLLYGREAFHTTTSYFIINNEALVESGKLLARNGAYFISQYQS
jgi:hypothetical protein